MIDIEKIAYGSPSYIDDLWCLAGNDVVLFELYVRRDEAVGEYAALPADHWERPLAERHLVGLQFGIDNHPVQSSIPERVLEYRGNALNYLISKEVSLAQAC